ncbi:LITAF domain-containing protein isoform X2 [Folsomia candida]|uniref:LITAF domain-containing protein isoform X2 n=1 Tax=Folsomia candida TaxID=158441 RepID=UPI000B9001BB|nr:LITAF domain-containing protein isoform X2 [Folsomia candida]
MKAPQAAPPSYNEAVHGVLPSSPLTAAQPIVPGPTIVTTIIPIGPRSTHMVCPHCHCEILTSTQTTPGMIAYISGAIIALLGCFWGCCLLPCCFDECMDIHHTCPNCSAFLGRYRR